MGGSSAWIILQASGLERSEPNSMRTDPLGRSSIVRVYFATDVHGSDLVWRKWLSVQRPIRADILILAGDLTGKAICPIVKQSGGSYLCNIFGRNLKMSNESELNEMKGRIARIG